MPQYTMGREQHLEHARKLMEAHPLIDSHVDLPYVMRAVRESCPLQALEVGVKLKVGKIGDQSRRYPW